LAGCHINQFGNNSGRTDINRYAEDFAVGSKPEVFFIYVRLDFGLRIDAAGKDFLLEESGSVGYGNCDIALDMVLTGLHLPALRLNVYQAFFTDSLATANGIQNDTGLARGFQESSAFVN